MIRVRLIDGFLTALGTLTVVPVGVREPDFEAALLWFPVVGFGVGIAVAVPGFLVSQAVVGKVLLAGFSGAVLDVLITGGMHLDGLGDAADGFFASASEGERLEIMKDPRLGSFGVAAVSLAVVGKVVALTALFSSGREGLVVIAYALSRASLVQLAASGTSARRGEGTGAPFIEAADLAKAVVAYVVVAPAALLSGFPVAWGLAALCPVLTFLYGRVVEKRFGGITGDLLGGCSELTLLAMLFLAGL